MNQVRRATGENIGNVHYPKEFQGTKKSAPKVIHVSTATLTVSGQRAEVKLTNQQAGDDTEGQKESKMADPTREEIDAKLEAVEARMDARIAKVEIKINEFIDYGKEFNKELRAETRSNFKNIVITIIVSMFALLAILIAVMQYGQDAAINAVTMVEQQHHESDNTQDGS